MQSELLMSTDLCEKFDGTLIIEQESLEISIAQDIMTRPFRCHVQRRLNR